MSTRALEALVDAAAAGPHDSLRDRYHGVLLGVAAGNALGLPVEGESRSAIRRHHPGGVLEVDPRESARPWDDDVAQTAVLAESLLETEELNPDLFASKLVRWSEENGRGIGQLTRDVLAEIKAGATPHDAAQKVWERSGWSTAGNGAIVRCSPVALRWRRSGPDLVRAARASARATHYDARCEWSVVAFSVALAAQLSGRPLGLAQLVEALQLVREEAAGPAITQVIEAIDVVEEAAVEDLSLDDPMDMGYTLKAMQVGLWCLRQADDFESVVTRVVGEGGDADTNGAIAGAAAGARSGAEGSRQPGVTLLQPSREPNRRTPAIESES
jgi:ADP-ribosyl-[dinitrogen reductase] hydrolase